MNKRLALLISAFLITGFFIGTSYGCVFRNTFGIVCPSCGISRAWQEIFSGNFRSAFAHHPMFWFPPVAIFCCCLKKPIISKRADLWILGILLAVYFIFYILKLL